VRALDLAEPSPRSAIRSATSRSRSADRAGRRRRRECRDVLQLDHRADEVTPVGSVEPSRAHNRARTGEFLQDGLLSPRASYGRKRVRGAVGDSPVGRAAGRRPEDVVGRDVTSRRSAAAHARARSRAPSCLARARSSSVSASSTAVYARSSPPVGVVSSNARRTDSGSVIPGGLAETHELAHRGRRAPPAHRGRASRRHRDQHFISALHPAEGLPTTPGLSRYQATCRPVRW